jgi:hemoglobin
VSADVIITEEALGRLVERFYAKVRVDALLGPVFEGAVADWPGHLERLQAFWSSVMLTSGRYKGRPLPAHLRHRQAMTADRFERWLALWRETTAELFAPEAAARLQDKAARIAESLSLAMVYAPIAAEEAA